ncbi:MAG: hypothetical protein KAJ00_07630, partial [Deltaproteobacteria bacterium]|nr:hypothetical protein [Deltaproteobacteria bacterium]
LRDMAVKEGYVDPSFPQQINEIDRFSQVLRDKILQAVVEKRAKKVTIEPKKLLKEIVDKL